jgi:Tol biopolymer transport system component
LSELSRQQRRAADRRGDGAADREAAIRGAFFIGLLVLIIGLFGWWYVRSGRGVVRDGAPSWSPKSDRVVYYSEQDGKAEIFSVDLDGGNREQLTHLPSSEGAPAWSPRGDSIAFDTDRDGDFEIYRMDVNGNTPERLTRHPGRDLAPAWSPDGGHIAFMSTRDNPEFDIYRMDKDGKNVERLTNGGSNWFPQYSPDGSQIAFHAMRDIHVLSLKDRKTRRLTHDPQNGMYPTWSADGSQIAFMSWRNGRTEIFTMASDGSSQTLLVSMPSGDAVDPRWSPNGQYIAFVHVPSGGVSQNQDAGQQRIVYVVDVKTKRLTRLSR